MRRLTCLATTVITAASGCLGLALISPAAQAQSDNEAKIEARIEAWGREVGEPDAAMAVEPAQQRHFLRAQRAVAVKEDLNFVGVHRGFIRAVRCVEALFGRTQPNVLDNGA